MITFLLKNNLIFSNRIFFLQDFIHLIPAEDYPRTEDKEQKSYDKSEQSRIEEYGNTENDTDNSKEEHKKIIYVLKLSDLPCQKSQPS